MSRPPQIAVIGRGVSDPELERLAEEVGRALAAAGATVVCGGLGGVMEAAARGAAGADGIVIGIVPGEEASDANPHCTHVVATGIGHARNLAVVASGDAVIAIGGEWGTLAEIGFARRLGRQVIALRSWELTPGTPIDDAAGVDAVDDPAEAVDRALGAARARLGSR
ncbi:MAG: TIGR00725 family protein [Solirubrobacterales bacterium]